MKFENILYFFLRAIWKLFSILPLPVMYMISDGLFYPFYYIIKYRRKITRKNLTESFPEKSKKEIIALEKGFYHFFLDMFFEICKFATISEEEIKKRMKFINPEEVNVLLNQGKYISLYLGHYGNWEWVSSIPLYLPPGIIGGQIYKKLHNELFDRLLSGNRDRLGAVNVEMKETLRWISERVRSQEIAITGYIADQSPRKRELKNYVPFLNHQTPVFVGTEKITKKFDMQAYYLDVKRVKRGYYEASFLRMHENPKSLPDYKLTEIYYKLLEKTIRRQPELYLWTHNRFKYATVDQVK